MSRLLAALAALLVLAPAAEARDATVTSFDGTPIVLSFFPAREGRAAPTVLVGHGWGGSRDTNPDSASSEQTGNVGLGPLRRAGFNVLTWDARGWGQSGGTIEVDSKDFEARDVQALLDWLARQPEARLDAPGDPRVGMTGVSYAGGIQLVTAAIDRRIDAIAPIIAWNSLVSSLYEAETVKGGWGSILYAAAQGHRYDPHIDSGLRDGVTTGRLTDEDRAWFASRGPGALVRRIRAPTLLVEGTVDTLFPLRESITNYRILKADRVPAKLVWFCGGHGACLTGSGPPRHVEGAVLAWLRRYVARDATADTGPRFEWLPDDAQWRAADDYPPQHGAPLTGAGSGLLAINPLDAASGTPVAAGRAANAVNVAISPPSAPVQVLGQPTLTLTYSGTGTPATGHVFAQVVDEARQLVLGNQTTPIPLMLDGRPHTITRPLEAVTASAPAGARYTLQLTGGTQVYGPAHTTATVGFASVKVSLPTAAAAAVSQTGATGLATAGGRRACLSRRVITLHLKRGLRSARVTVAGRRARVRRRHGRLVATVDLRGRVKGAVKVRVVARDRRGHRVRETRTFRTCTPKKSKRR